MFKHLEKKSFIYETVLLHKYASKLSTKILAISKPIAILETVSLELDWQPFFLLPRI